MNLPINTEPTMAAAFCTCSSLAGVQPVELLGREAEFCVDARQQPREQAASMAQSGPAPTTPTAAGQGAPVQQAAGTLGGSFQGGGCLRAWGRVVRVFFLHGATGFPYRQPSSHGWWRAVVPLMVCGASLKRHSAPGAVPGRRYRSGTISGARKCPAQLAGVVHFVAKRSSRQSPGSGRSRCRCWSPGAPPGLPTAFMASRARPMSAQPPAPVQGWLNTANRLVGFRLTRRR